jgi:hypothetical protein
MKVSKRAKQEQLCEDVEEEKTLEKTVKKFLHIIEIHLQV